LKRRDVDLYITSSRVARDLKRRDYPRAQSRVARNQSAETRSRRYKGCSRPETSRQYVPTSSVNELLVMRVTRDLKRRDVGQALVGGRLEPAIPRPSAIVRLKSGLACRGCLGPRMPSRPVPRAKGCLEPDMPRRIDSNRISRDEGCSGPETPRPAGFRPCCCEGFSGPETPRRRVCPPPRASGGEGCLGPEMPRRSTNVVIPKVVWDLRCQDHDDPLGRALPVAAPVDGCLEPEMPRRLTTVLYQRLFGT